MNKYLLLFFTILFFLTVNAQNGCQELTPIFSSTTVSETIEIDTISGISYIYYDLCVGESISLEPNPEFNENTTFEWVFNESPWTSSNNSQNFENIFNNSGGNTVSITVSQEGCEQYSLEARIRVGTVPQINLNFDSTIVCPGITSSLSSSSSSDVNFSVAIETDGWASEPCEDEDSQVTYIPDGDCDSYPDLDDPSCAVYYSPINLSCFGEDQLLTDINDILSVDVNITHSFSGDLTILLEAPNGSMIELMNGYDEGAGSTWLGEATWGDDTEENPGIGWDYGWSMNPEYNGTMSEAIDNNYTIANVPNPLGTGDGNALTPSTYLPHESFNTLLGSNLNGDWTLIVVDRWGQDNGWVFSWGISINQLIIPSNWSFQNYIEDQYFLYEDNIIANYGDSILINPEPGIHNYTYEVVDNFGCIFQELVEITATSYINPNPIITQEECGGTDGQIDLNISGGTPDYTVTWDSEITGEIISDLSEGTYFYAITDGLGCEISGNETIQNIETGLTFDTEIFDDHCDQAIGEIILTPTNGAYPYNYTWSHSNTNQDSTANNLFGGTYEVFILDSDGCEGNLSIDIDNISGPTAFFNQNFDTVTYVDGIVDFLNFSSAANQTELVNNQWSFGNGEFSNLESPSYNFNQIGNYFVQLTVTDNYDCSDSYIREVVAVEDYFIWTPSAFTPNGDGKNDLYIPRFHNIIEESFEFFIYDKWGKIVYETTDINTGWDGIRQDNGKAADNSSYSFLAKFITYKNELKKKTGSFLLLK